MMAEAPLAQDRRLVSRRLAVLAAAIVILLLAPTHFAQARRYTTPHFSAIVIDAQSGKILNESNADQSTYPASLTKMMTLYLVFEALEQGRISLDDTFTVSLHAARQAPSKIDLIPGQKIRVQDLILGLITKSANDAAVTVAENLAGNEAAFADRMTQKARALGMTDTIFRNASGLPNPAQHTTARDIAKLALALWRDFPKEYAFFATEEFTYRDTTYETHNHLMQEFAGMDGIKTGYIRAAGFNLAASAVRDGRRLIGVIMGGSSAHGRDMQMAQLLEASFAGNPISNDALRTAAYDDGSNNNLDGGAAHTIAALNPVSRAEASTPRQTAHRNKPSHPDASSTGWSIQVGAFANYDAAQSAGAAALAKLPAAKDKTALVLSPAHSDKQPFYRARIAGFTETEAQKACRTLHNVMSSKQKLCAVIPPQPASQTMLQLGPPALAPAPVQPAAQPAAAPAPTSKDD
ncbi:MAG TPA: D-alanyl-D-alanine carboxypeptidase family protein [Stellaceae bacterium]|nr:D-alanyl-D-alanine carboxypeptidase family protein [Stellaceae bacterium]